MAAPALPSRHVTRDEEEEEEEYESDDYDVEDDEGDQDFQADDADEDEEDEEDDEAEGEGERENLTALLVADPNVAAQADDEDDDEGYAPPGQIDPADLPIDGNARAPILDSSSVSKEATNSTTAPAVVAAGLKRKTSGDEGDEEEEQDEDESDAKKLKS